MNKLSTWSKINLLLSLIFLMVGFLKPILVEKFNYSGKIKEAESVVRNIAENQNQNYSIQNEYIAVKKSEQSILDKKFDKISQVDLKHYDYVITTTINSFTIIAEPKIEFVEKREVAPKIYTYRHILNGKDSKKWSNL